ncbi:hypothetical protein VC83_04804 [Pseudogymnoascus destructans]|uniref:Uncharacterized protein n=1 Tax=Pseudogymnoascus destructans TaxID=655981 RepID=A0A177A5P7_9PEZI|nr:uncharacterized protein VC83_04804 [Pseudogymnoascus destructans]OAF57437.1 hypothetical protein VC83_04804 [Pseudogymnoascus destructans]
MGREVVAKLLKMMELWSWSSEWVIELTVLREAVVSVREEVADEKMTMTMALNTVNPTRRGEMRRQRRWTCRTVEVRVWVRHFGLVGCDGLLFLDCLARHKGTTTKQK